jgi:hypothetical protein
MRHFGISCVFAAFLTLCALPGEAEVRFLDRSALPVQQSYEGEWTHYVGGGLAVLDCNDDNLPDFYAAGGSAPSRLFVNTSARGGDREWTKHGGHAWRFLFATVSRPSRTAALVTATR